MPAYGAGALGPESASPSYHGYAWCFLSSLQVHFTEYESKEE